MSFRWPPTTRKETHPDDDTHPARQVMEVLRMAEQLNDSTRQWYFLAHLKTYQHDWFSLHLSEVDAERQLRAVAEAWDDVWFTPDDEPVGVLFYGIEEVPLLGPEESGEAPKVPTRRVLT